MLLWAIVQSCVSERVSLNVSVNSIELLTAYWGDGMATLGGAPAIPPNGPSTLGFDSPLNDTVVPPPVPWLVVITWEKTSSRSPPPSLVHAHSSPTLKPAPCPAHAPRPSEPSPITALSPLTMVMPSSSSKASDTSSESDTSAPEGTPVLVLRRVIVSSVPSIENSAPADSPLSGWWFEPPASNV